MSTYHIFQSIFEFVMIITIAVMIYEQDRLTTALENVLQKLKDKGKFPIALSEFFFDEVDLEELEGDKDE